MNKNEQGFKKIEDSFCVLFTKGSYKQVEIYEREGLIFAKFGGGFIKVYQNGYTSKNEVVCKGINCMGVIWKEGAGGLEVQNESS